MNRPSGGADAQAVSPGGHPGLTTNPAGKHMQTQQYSLLYAPVPTDWPEVHYTQWPDGTRQAGYRGPPAPLVWAALGAAVGFAAGVYVCHRYG